MADVLRVFPHRDGPWLVRAGRVILGVPPAIGMRLQDLDGKSAAAVDLRSRLATDGSHEALARKLEEGLEDHRFSWRKILAQRNPVWLRLPLLPARVVRKVARGMTALARPQGLWLLGILGVWGCIIPHMVHGPSTTGSLTTQGLTLGIAIFLVSALWHEIGHATALLTAGYESGGLGLGMLLVLPVLFVDVTPVALLPRPGRLRVNIAGPLFQLSLAAVLRGLGLALPLTPVWEMALRVAADSATLAVTWSLWPFIRSDGYWLVCDALGIKGLDRPVPPGLSATKRALVSFLRLANMVFLLVIGVVLTITLDQRTRILDSDLLFGGGRSAVVVWGFVVLAVGIWFGLLSRVLYLGRLLMADLRPLSCPCSR